MTRFVLAASLTFLVSAFSQETKSDSFIGRWDITLRLGAETWPSWMEVTGAGSTPDVRVVGRVASVHPAKDVKRDGDHLTFTTQEWFGKTVKVDWNLRMVKGALTGTQKRETGETAKLIAYPAPKLDRPMPAAWAKPAPLFDGTDLAGWKPEVTGEPGKSPTNHYKAINGELVNEAPGANIQTTRPFGDFKLHAEYNCPDGGNSGVYLRGRYEVQVEYEKPGENDRLHGMGAVYGFLAPSTELPRKPGQWESYDITLVGRRVTIVRDGVTTIDNREIPGITGGAINSNESEPGPLLIQGDHTGGMKYRNITIQTPAPTR